MVRGIKLPVLDRNLCERLGQTADEATFESRYNTRRRRNKPLVLLARRSDRVAFGPA
ncbi:MAG: hypothetical protein ACM3MK_08380 [Chitinophagales bacterium]